MGKEISRDIVGRPGCFLGGIGGGENTKIRKGGKVSWQKNDGREIQKEW